jgi:apolipoprotein N-acyltransferase
VSLSFPTLKRLSFAHSVTYAALLIVWLVPGLALGERIFGFAHGIGWICMVLLILLALRARVVPLRTAFAVSILGAVAPFFGSWEFVREERRRDASRGPRDPSAADAPPAR